MTQPRGIRNHNPGNIEKGDPWQGLSDDQSRDERFAIFGAPEWGIRAIARVLITYQDKHDIRTVQGILRRWAPSFENDTNAYIEHVAEKVKIAPDTQIDVTDYSVMRPLVEAIIKHENGQQPYKRSTIDKGLMLAGIDIPSTRVEDRKADKAVKGAGASAAGAGVAEQVGEMVEATQPAMPLLTRIVEVAPWLLIAAAVGLFAFWAIKHYRD